MPLTNYSLTCININTISITSCSNCINLTLYIVTSDQCCNRLNATEYGDLKDKLRSPIMNIRNIIIRQTLSERFLEAFRFHVEQNEAYRKPPDMVMYYDN